jgi:hypothetical protein
MAVKTLDNNFPAVFDKIFGNIRYMQKKPARF